MTTGNAQKVEAKFCMVSVELIPLIRDLLDLHSRQRQLMDKICIRRRDGLPAFDSETEEVAAHYAFALDEDHIYNTYSSELVARALEATKGAVSTMELLRAPVASDAVN